MNNVIADIVAKKKETLANRMKEMPVIRLREMANKAMPRRDFRAAVSRRDRVNIIAEIKKASPSSGIIAERFNPVEKTRVYSAAGASAISVLTEEHYFKGDLSYLQMVRENTSLPVLRKDFIFDVYQIYESLVFGADAVLIIAALVDLFTLIEMLDLAHNFGLDCLVEVHDEKDLDKAIASNAEIIGLNNRDLETFEVDMDNAGRLLPRIPRSKIVVVESGIKEPGHIEKYHQLGINSFLVGETLMRSADVSATIREMKGAING